MCRDNPGRQPLADLPADEPFIRRYAPLPDPVQLCLVSTYEGQHRDECAATFNDAPPRNWILFKQLFLAQ